MPKLRNAVCGLMAVIFPCTVSLTQTGLAMLYSQGGVRLNGASPPSVISVFPDDTIETAQGSMAKLNVNGSAVTIQPDSLVRYEGNYVVLEHGSVAVDTSAAFAVHVECMIVTPVRVEASQYDVTDTNSDVTVYAHKLDVNIDRKNQDKKLAAQDAQSDRVTVREGERKTRQEKCAAAAVPHSAVAGLHGPLLNSAWMKGLGAGAIAGVACWVFCWKTDDPISPDTP